MPESTAKSNRIQAVTEEKKHRATVEEESRWREQQNKTGENAAVTDQNTYSPIINSEYTVEGKRRAEDGGSRKWTESGTTEQNDKTEKKERKAAAPLELDRRRKQHPAKRRAAE
ncbi:uncharacterized protein V6R79_008889 [Siganus canaliculatus]